MADAKRKRILAIIGLLVLNGLAQARPAPAPAPAVIQPPLPAQDIGAVMTLSEEVAKIKEDGMIKAKAFPILPDPFKSSWSQEELDQLRKYASDLDGDDVILPSPQYTAAKEPTLLSASTLAEFLQALKNSFKAAWEGSDGPYLPTSAGLEYPVAISEQAGEDAPVEDDAQYSPQEVAFARVDGGSKAQAFEKAALAYIASRIRHDTTRSS